MPVFQKRHRDEAEEHFRQGQRYRDRRNKEFNFARSVEHFKKAIELNSDDPQYHSELGRAYVAAPLLAITHGISGVKLEDCLSVGIEELQKALQLDSEYKEAYLVLGEAYRCLGETQKAAEAFQAVLNLPSISLLGDRVLKSYAKRELKQLEQGENRQCQPDVAQEHVERAMLYRDEKKYRLAELELGYALKLSPSWSWLYHTACELAESR